MIYENEIPDFALVPARPPEETLRTPIVQGAVYTPLQVTKIAEHRHTAVQIEEDLLVPDTRPDLKEILDISAKVRLASQTLGPYSKEEETIPLTGEIELQTLYLPEKAAACGPVIATSNRISFRETWHTAAAEGTVLTLEPRIESIEYKVINERKFRISIRLSVSAREWQDVRLEVFEGLAGEEIQTLRQSVEISSAALRKKDIFSVKETLAPRDKTPQPEAILRQEIRVVENYRQAAAEKAVINGFICINALCSASAAADDGVPAEAADSSSSDLRCTLFQIQERVEFTQFIPLSQSGTWSGCSVTFDSSDLRIKLAAGEDGTDALCLEGDLVTWLVLYRNTEKEIITDAYHRQKDFVCDFEEFGCRTLTGTATGEASVRELISLESIQQDAEQILHVSASVSEEKSHAESGRIVTEGTLTCCFLCRSGSSIFSVSHSLPFRCVTASACVQEGDVIRHKVYLKEYWAEKLGGRQAEFNAGILVCAEIMRPVPLRLLKNPAFEETPGRTAEAKPMAIYIVKDGDTLWSVSRQFKSTMDSIRQANQLEGEPLRPGQKLLILQ